MTGVDRNKVLHLRTLLELFLLSILETLTFTPLNLFVIIFFHSENVTYCVHRRRKKTLSQCLIYQNAYGHMTGGGNITEK